MGVLTSILLFIGNALGLTKVGAADGRKFNVTDGSIWLTKSGLLQTTSPAMRAVLGTGTDSIADVSFTYNGPTKKTSKLADGNVRNQFGLKMRAQDPCNLLYIMWRFSSNEIVISTKLNSALHTSDQCGDTGYVNLAVIAVPSVQRGSGHTLKGSINGSTLSVVADGNTIWSGALPANIMAINGPVGVRSDNAQLVFAFKTTN